MFISLVSIKRRKKKEKKREDKVFFDDVDRCSVKKITADGRTIKTLCSNILPSHLLDGESYVTPSSPSSHPPIFFSSVNSLFVSDSWEPRAICCTPSGGLYVSDTWRNRILFISPSGEMSVYFGGQQGYSPLLSSPLLSPPPPPPPPSLPSPPLLSCAYTFSSGQQRLITISGRLRRWHLRRRAKR